MPSPDTVFIILAHPRWDAPYSSTSYSMAKTLAKTHKVYYIDNPFTLKVLISQRNNASIKKRWQALVWGKNWLTNLCTDDIRLWAVTPRVVWPINFLPKGVIYQLFWAWNNRIITACVKKLLKTENINSFVYINSYNPVYGFGIKQKCKPLLSIYECVDDISQETYTGKHGTRMEQITAAQADVCITTSMELKRIIGSYNPKVFYLPNAADTRIFLAATSQIFPVPPEIEACMGKKIIGYTGNIGTRIDYELLGKIALHHADKILLMVGPKDRDYYPHNCLLDNLPNVVFTGKKALHELPQYLQYMHCTIIPFERTKLTKSIYPLKINEYLAAGKATVLTNFSEDVQQFDAVTYIAENDEDFLQYIDKAMNENNAEKIAQRQQMALPNTWEARVQKLHDIINATV